MYVKIDEKSWGLFRTNDELLAWLAIVRLADEDGHLIYDETRIAHMAKITPKAAKQAIEELLLQPTLMSVSEDGYTLCCRKLSQWRTRGSSIPAAPKIERKAISIDEQKFNDGMRERYPRVQSLREPLTLQQWNDLINEYPSKALRDVLVAMENWKPLCEKCVSVNLTIRNWIRRRQ